MAKLAIALVMLSYCLGAQARSDYRPKHHKYSQNYDSGSSCIPSLREAVNHAIMGSDYESGCSSYDPFFKSKEDHFLWNIMNDRQIDKALRSDKSLELDRRLAYQFARTKAMADDQAAEIKALQKIECTDSFISTLKAPHDIQNGNVEVPPPNICTEDPYPMYSMNLSNYLSKTREWRDYQEILNFSVPIRTTVLNFLFKEPSGAGDYGNDYSILEHTSRVLKVFHEQNKFYQVDTYPHPAILKHSNGVILDYALAVHDIGKSIANRAGDKRYEVIYSVPLANRILSSITLPDHSQFSKDEVNVMTELIRYHQLIGQYTEGRYTTENTIAYINSAVQNSKLDSCTFYLLLEMVFISDAGSYNTLRDSVFAKAEGSHDRDDYSSDWFSNAKAAVKASERYKLLSDHFRATCPANFKNTPVPQKPRHQHSYDQDSFSHDHKVEMPGPGKAIDDSAVSLPGYGVTVEIKGNGKTVTIPDRARPNRDNKVQFKKWHD